MGLQNSQTGARLYCAFSDHLKTTGRFPECREQTSSSLPATNDGSWQTIKNAKDVEAVEKQLDNIDVVGSFEKDLDSESSF